MVAGLLALSAVFGGAATRSAAAPPQFADLGDCPLVSGAVIKHCRVGYRVYGAPNSDRSNLVLFPSWYNGQTADMSLLVQPGVLLDPSKYFVITIDALGDGVSSSPSNGAAGQTGVAFPKFTIRDMVDIEHRLAISVFHAAHVHAVVGVSMGGMQAYEWAVRYPRYMDVVIAIEGTPWLNAADRLTWSIMRQSIEEDPDYRGGRYEREPRLKLGNEVDNMFAYTPAYRARTTSAASFPSYLAETDGEASIGANNRIWQIDAIQHLDILEGASVGALAHLDLPRMLVVTSANDHTVNPGPTLEWAKRTSSRLLVLDSDCGHMAILCEVSQIATAVDAALAR